MKNLFKIASLLFVAMLLSFPVMSQSRHNGGNNGGNSRQTTERRAQQSQKSNNTTVRNRPSAPARSENQRPAVNNQRQNQTERSINRQLANRPGNQNGNSGLRPGVNNPPQGNNPQTQRPGSQTQPGGQQGMRPGANNPQQGFQPGMRPGVNNQPSGNRPAPGQPSGMRPNPTPKPQPPLQRPPVMPPMRPDRPPMYPYSRPLPPPAWRPAPGGPILSTILGITLGTAIGVSLDYLFNNGYAVDGYDSDVVYLRNVNQLNYAWPDAALYYGPYGLTGSRFIYSTIAYNPTRYNMVYRDLVRLYGSPAQLVRQNGGYLATWFGVGNNYVQLQFAPEIVNGSTRFFTTLSFGN